MSSLQNADYYARFSTRAGVPFHRVTSITQPFLATARGLLLFTSREVESLPAGPPPAHYCFNCQRSR